jgi:5'-nucleotidase/UDP-sugar diphosphatase
MRRAFRGTVFFTLFVSLLGQYAVSQPKNITVLHTNDMHASFVPHDAFWVRSTPKPLVGGYVNLAAAVDSMRALRSTLLLDAGDVMTGNPIAEMEYHGATGGALFEIMNRIGYEAWTPGNHDFDISRSNFVALTKLASFPITAPNLKDENGALLGTAKPYVLLEKNGLRIGIIGWMSKQYYNLVGKQSTVGISLDTSLATLQALIDEVDPKTDLIIALTHQGVDDDSVMATRLHGVDVIIGGHSHTRLRTPLNVNGIVIAQAGSNVENLGILNLTVDQDHVIAYDGSLLQLWHNSARPKTSLSEFVDSLQTVIDRDYSTVLGTLAIEWTRQGGESGVGNFLADAQREAVKADVAFMNNGGIRKDVPAGPITKKSLYEVLPFRNTLTTFCLTGAQLRSIIEHHVSAQSRDRDPMQTSGIWCRWKRNVEGKPEITEVKINGKPLDEARTYIGTASDYVMGESKRYLGLDTPKLTVINKTVFDVVAAKIREMKIVDAKIEGRIVEVK